MSSMLSLMAMLFLFAKVLSLSPLINRSYDLSLREYTVFQEAKEFHTKDYQHIIKPKYGGRNLLPLEEITSVLLSTTKDSKIKSHREVVELLFENADIWDVFMSLVINSNPLYEGINLPEFLQSNYDEISEKLFTRSTFRDYYLDNLGGLFSRYFAIIDLMIRYYFCMLDLDPEVNCPGPCHGQDHKCQALENTDGTCTPILPDARRYTFELSELTTRHLTYESAHKMMSKFISWVRLMPKKRQLPSYRFNMELAESRALFLFMPMFFRFQLRIGKEASCNCRFGATYKPSVDKCIDIMSELLCGGNNPCKHGGVCNQRVINGTRTDEIECDCPAAFTGQFCHQIRNPCLILPANEACGRFPCFRDPNHQLGYRCRCPRYYKATSSANPQCKPRNVCKDTKPCRNRATCVNKIGNFHCNCLPHFLGRRCEIAPPPPHWAAWSEWSPCIIPDRSHFCDDEPHQVQMRDCMVNVLQQRCLGPRRRYRFTCPGVDLNDWYAHCKPTMPSTAPINEEQLGESLNYDDEGDDDEDLFESDPPVETRGFEHLPPMIVTLTYTWWFVLFLMQFAIVWALSSVLTNFISSLFAE